MLRNPFSRAVLAGAAFFWLEPASADVFFTVESATAPIPKGGDAGSIAGLMQKVGNGSTIAMSVTPSGEHNVSTVMRDGDLAFGVFVDSVNGDGVFRTSDRKRTQEVSFRQVVLGETIFSAGPTEYLFEDLHTLESVQKKLPSLLLVLELARSIHNSAGGSTEEECLAYFNSEDRDGWLAQQVDNAMDVLLLDADSYCSVIAATNVKTISTLLAALSEVSEGFLDVKTASVQPSGEYGEFTLWISSLNDYLRFRKQPVNAAFDVSSLPMEVTVKAERHDFNFTQDIRMFTHEDMPPEAAAMMRNLKMFLNISGSAWLATDALNPNLPISLDAINMEMALGLHYTSASLASLKDEAKKATDAFGGTVESKKSGGVNVSGMGPAFCARYASLERHRDNHERYDSYKPADGTFL